MYDEAKLRAQHKMAVTVCTGVALVPLILVIIASLIGVDPEAAAEDNNTVLLAIYGAMALSPLVTGPLVMRYAMSQAGSSTTGPEANAAIWAITRFTLWEVSSLLGFVGYLLSGSWVFFAACIAITYAGYAHSFPRWSTLVELVERQAEAAARPPIISG